MNNHLENTISLVTTSLKSALKGRDFCVSTRESDNHNQMIITVILPLKPEDGVQIKPIDLLLNLDGSISFRYALDANFCVSKGRGCIVANAINEAMDNAPIKCIYAANEFHIFSAINSSKQLVRALNRLLSVIEFSIIMTDYMSGDDDNKGCDFDCVFSIGNYANDSIFEDYNIVD